LGTLYGTLRLEGYIMDLRFPHLYISNWF
jgi:hypothetical protein